MKAKVISATGYSFDAEVVGKVFNVVEDFGHGVRLDIKNTSNNGFWNFPKSHVQLIEDTVSEQGKKSKTKVRQKPKKQTQTKVYISYRDGSSHLTKRVVNIVVRAEDKVVAVTSERNVDGLIIRENVTIPSTSVDWIDITSKEARHSYFFDEQGQVKASCQWFGKDHKFKTRSH